MGDNKLQSVMLRVPVRSVLQYARVELMKLTVFRQSTQFASYNNVTSTGSSSAMTSSSSSSFIATPCSCACCHAFAIPIAIRRLKSDQLLHIGDSLLLPPLSQAGKVRAFELVCAQESPLTPAYSFLHQVTSRASLLALRCHDEWLDQQGGSIRNCGEEEVNQQIAMMESTVEELTQQLDRCYRAYNQILLSHSPLKSASSVTVEDVPVVCAYNIAHFYTLDGIIVATTMSGLPSSNTTYDSNTAALAATLESEGVAPQLTECVSLIACTSCDPVESLVGSQEPQTTQ